MISEPGKFEGQLSDVPALYAEALECGADETFGDIDEFYGVYFRLPDAHERMRYFVEDIQGFVVELTKAEFNAARRDYYGEEE